MKGWLETERTKGVRYFSSIRSKAEKRIVYVVKRV